MRSWGFTIIIMAVLSAVLPYIGIQFLLLSWVDTWGAPIGWAIRGGLVLVGIVMIVMSGKQQK